jgi:hypothetical protein
LIVVFFVLDAVSEVSLSRAARGLLVVAPTPVEKSSVKSSSTSRCSAQHAMAPLIAALAAPPLAALAAAVAAHFVFAALFYSPLLVGDLFFRLSYGASYKKIMKQNETEGMLGGVAVALLGCVSYVLVCGCAISAVGAATRLEAVAVALALTLAGESLWVSHHLFERRPTSVHVIHVAGHVIEALMVGAILGSWLKQ